MTGRRGARRREGGARGPFLDALAGSWSERARFGLVVALLALLAIGGGASRPDVWSLLALRPACVLIGVVLLLLPGPVEWRAVRAPLILLAAFAATMLVQLVPLPPDLWLSLPGHARYAEAAAAAGVPQPWRPISLAPALTLNSLVSLVAPAAVLIGVAAVRPDQRRALLPVVVAIAGASAVWGILQIAAGDGLHLYRITNRGRPVGLLANINHQAALLAAALPLLAAWAVAAGRGRPDFIRPLVALGAALFFVAAVLVGGSRAGALLVALGAIAAPLVIHDRVGRVPGGRPVLIGGVLAAAALLVGAALFFGRALAFDRLLTLGGEGADGRVAYLPVTLQVMREFLPFGAGFGTFAPVFRGFEPDAILKLTYFNHAHNDLLELAITGGVPACLVALAYLAWLGRCAVAAFGPAARGAPGAVSARAGTVVAGLLLTASLLDYPLRTPLLAAVLALASAWAAGFRSPSRR